jgi:quercetin dioxygenase-like cupin family protein
MRIVRPTEDAAERIGSRPYPVRKTSSLEIAAGDGEAHAYVLYFQPGGEIGPHEAGYGQLFLALSGEGWVAGGDGVPQAIASGEAAFISPGEIHSKGSETGMTALMVQVRDFSPLSPSP